MSAGLYTALDWARYLELGVEHRERVTLTKDAALKIAAFLKSGAEQGETEWEYGSVGYCFDNEVNRRCYFESNTAVSVIEHAREAHANDNNPDVDSDDSGHWKKLRHRRKAGPWEPVPDTTNTESED